MSHRSVMHLLGGNTLAGRVFLREVRHWGSTSAAERQPRPHEDGPLPAPRVVPQGLLLRPRPARRPAASTAAPRRGRAPSGDERDGGLRPCESRPWTSAASDGGGEAAPAVPPPRPPAECTKAALASRAKTNWPMRSFSSGCTSRAASSHSRRQGRQAAQGKAQRTLPMGPATRRGRRRGRRLGPPLRHRPSPPLHAASGGREGGTLCRGAVANPMSESPMSDRGMRKVPAYQGKGGACG